MTPMEELENQHRQIQEAILQKQREIERLEEALSIVEEKMFWLESSPCYHTDQPREQIDD